MERGSLLPVEGLGHKHVATDGINAVDPTRGLISTSSCDAVADAYVLVLIWADLKTEPEKKKFNREENLALTSHAGQTFPWAKRCNRSDNDGQKHI